MITVYYDSRCGLCRREINHYRVVAPDGVFVWKDAIDYAPELEKEGISVKQALLALHARDGQHTMHTGVDAFILIWSNLSRWRWLAWFAKLPLVHPVAAFLYGCFARWKFRRSAHCQQAENARQH